MSDFIAAEDRAILERHGLADYDALWALQLEAVDEPNTERGGWSSVYRLDLGEAGLGLGGVEERHDLSGRHPLASLDGELLEDAADFYE